MKENRRSTVVRHARPKTVVRAAVEPCEPRLMMSRNVGADPLAPVITGGVIKAATQVQVTWANKEKLATGYDVYRSTDGANFSLLAHIASPKTVTYVDSTAQSNTSYTYEVKARVGDANSPASNLATARTPLSAVTALAGHASVSGGATITWAGADGSATGYYVLRSTDKKTFAQVANVTGPSATSFNDTNVMSGHAYYYEVQPHDGSSHVGLIAAAATTVTPLASPTGTAASVLSATQVRVTWTAMDSNSTYYSVLRSMDGGAYKAVGKANGLGTQVYLDAGLLPYHAYAYKVQAMNAVASSEPSAPAQGSTPLQIPSSVTVKGTSPTSLAVSWVDSDLAPTSFKILRSTNGTDFSELATVTNPKLRSYADATVSSNTRYWYEVQAIAGTNSSTASTAGQALTAIATPTGVTATPQSGTRMSLAWTDNDATATGYTLYRSANGGKTFTTLATLTDGTANTYTDETVASGAAYVYQVQATGTGNTSAKTANATAITPLSKPTNLAGTVTGGSAVTLTWAKVDASTTGYYIYRSVDGGTTFATLAKVAGSATSFKDAAVTSAKTYVYKIAGFSAATTSDKTDAVTLSTTLNAPVTLAATPVGAWVNLTWVAKDTVATGYTVLRSDDGGQSYSAIGTTTSSAPRYSDTTATSGDAYSYAVVATKGNVQSAATAAVSIVAPTGGSNGAITITTRYDDELVISASGANDVVALSQSGSTLTIVADGQTYTQDVPGAGVFIYARGGADGITIDASVSVRTTIEAIDGATTAVVSHGSDVSAWIDGADSFSGSGNVHSVASFVGNTAKTMGVAAANPKDIGTTRKITGASLWGAGPVAGDVNQGGIGDCYFLSSLAAFANLKPATLQESAVDMGDGTYVVGFQQAGAAKYYRVSNDFGVGGYGPGLRYAYYGDSGDIWAMVLEKAFAYARSGANTYASINSGFMDSVYALFGVGSHVDLVSTSTSESDFLGRVSTALSANRPVTLGTPSNPKAPNLVSGHAYTLVRVTTESDGSHRYVVRNPWGVKGDALEDSDGYATLTFSQVKVNFNDDCIATS